MAKVETIVKLLYEKTQDTKDTSSGHSVNITSMSAHSHIELLYLVLGLWHHYYLDGEALDNTDILIIIITTI